MGEEEDRVEDEDEVSIDRLVAPPLVFALPFVVLRTGLAHVDGRECVRMLTE